MRKHEYQRVRGPRRVCLATMACSAPCQVCGQYSDITHLALDRSGTFCPLHCACSREYETVQRVEPAEVGRC